MGFGQVTPQCRRVGRVDQRRGVGRHRRGWPVVSRRRRHPRGPAHGCDERNRRRSRRRHPGRGGWGSRHVAGSKLHWCGCSETPAESVGRAGRTAAAHISCDGTAIHQQVEARRIAIAPSDRNRDSASPGSTEVQHRTADARATRAHLEQPEAPRGLHTTERVYRQNVHSVIVRWSYSERLDHVIVSFLPRRV